jgi:hypothetical protein
LSGVPVVFIDLVVDLLFCSLSLTQEVSCLLFSYNDIKLGRQTLTQCSKNSFSGKNTCEIN